MGLGSCRGRLAKDARPVIKPSSRVAPHEAVRLPGGALVGLSSKKKGEGHDVFRGLDSLAAFQEDRAGLSGVRLSDAFGENRAGDELVDADIVLPQF